MWQAAGYFDESDDNERAYAVAGTLGHQHDCVYLHWRWEESIIKKYEIEYFKASELNSGAGQFAKFRDDPTNVSRPFSQREKDLFRKIKVESIDIFLEFPELWGVGVVMLLPDYYRLLEERKACGKTLPKPYFFCAQLVMMATGALIYAFNSIHRPEQKAIVRPVFDSQEQYSGRAKQMFDEFCRKNPFSSNYLLPPHYETEQKYVALQVADNVAYECRRLLITTEYDTHIPEREAMKRLKQQMLRVYKLNYETMKMIIEGQRSDEVSVEPTISNENPWFRDWPKLTRKN